MSRFVKAARKFTSEGYSHDTHTPAQSPPEGVSELPSDTSQRSSSNEILLGTTPQPTKSGFMEKTSAKSPAGKKKRTKGTNSSSQDAIIGSPAETGRHTKGPSMSSSNTAQSSSQAEPGIGEGSLKLEHLIPGESVQASDLHPRSPHLNSSAGSNPNTHGNASDLPGIAVQVASSLDPASTSVGPTRPSMSRKPSDLSEDGRTLARPRSVSNISANSTTDRTGRPRSSSSAPRRNGTSPYRPGTTPLTPPVPASKTRSFTVGSRTKSSSSDGIAGALAMSGIALGAPSSAGHPGMSFQHPFASPPGSTTSRSRAPSLTGGDDANVDDGDGIDRFGSIDSQMGDFGYIDDVDLGSGYALAGIKRNQDFHQLFENVPEHDALIEDYGCALWKDILTQGRLYISEHHLCFYANILGWITNLVIPFSEVISIEKRMTAYVIPNAITVKTLHAHHTFASFLSRDTTYALIVDIWSKSHPNIPPGAALPDHGNSYEDEDAVEEEVTVAPTDDQPPPQKKSRLRIRRGGKGSAAAPSVSEAQANANAALSPVNGPGSPLIPKTTTHHRVTQVPGNVPMFKDVCMDATFAGSPEKIYNLMFTSEGFMRDFWTNNQHLTEIEIGEWKPSDKQLLERTVTYIKPLNGSIGPKSMKCYITDANENVDFDDYISVLTTTRTPDAPSGNAFAIKTRTCFTWAPNNCCRVQVTTTVEWTKSSFLKGVITSSALEGQKTYHADLVKVIKTYMHKHKSEFQHSSGGEDIDDTVADAVDDEPELAVPVETNASSTSTLKQVAETSVEAAKGAVGFLVEAATGNSIATAIIAILFVFNLWTLLISRSSSDAELLPGSRARAPPGSHLRSGDDVADAVRRVLGEYFAPPHLHTRQVPTAAPVMADTDPTQELEDIFTALEDLEGRVARLRTLLTNQEVTEN